MKHVSAGILIAMAAVLLALPVSVFAVEMDLVTLDTAAHTTSAGLVPAGGDQPYEILWDLTHGVYLLYQPSGYFSNLTAVLSGEGFNMNTTDLGVHNIDLTVYDVVVVSVTSAWNTAYTAEEVDSLISFVDQGGGLLVMGANSGCPNGNINPVCEAFGTTCGLPSMEPADLYFTNFMSHQIFDGITTVYFRATGRLNCIAPSVEAAWSPAYSEVMVSLIDPSPPLFVAMGTSTGWSNNYFSQAENVDFAINVFEFLAGIVIPLERTTWGAIKTLDN